MIAVVDYGMGNLRSVTKALEFLGAQVQLTSSPRVLARAEKIVLPGVGEFGSAMRELARRKLIDPIVRHITAGKIYLGICLGLQLLFEKSEESPGVRGFGVLPGRVRKFSFPRKKRLKIPQMGWNQVDVKSRSPFLKGLSTKDFFYFVHSYYGDPTDSSQVLGWTTYGIRFPSAIGSRNVFAVQFHPEKSQDPGLQILKNFIRL